MTTGEVSESTHVRSAAFRRKLIPASEAAELVEPGSTLLVGGFAGAGVPAAAPRALADRMKHAHDAGNEFDVRIVSGASTGPHLDGVLARAGGIGYRTPYQSDPLLRHQINHGNVEYADLHLSHVAQMCRQGLLGSPGFALVEVIGITEEGGLIPSSAVGNNQAYLDVAERVIIEVNTWHHEEWYGLHDVYQGRMDPPHRQPLMVLHPGDRIGAPTMRVDPDKVVGVIISTQPDEPLARHRADPVTDAIAGHLLEFYAHEHAMGRLPTPMLPIQAGVGNIAGAVLKGFLDAPFGKMTAYTEIISDEMLDLIDAGVMTTASTAAMMLSDTVTPRFNENVGKYHGKIIIRSQEISNHPEIIRRLGVLSINGMVEADIYGNVNSTHVNGTSIITGIGGSGDFARSAQVSVFASTSTAHDGAISKIVPMVSHVDHTEHDVHVIVTEHGIADLRGLAPRRRAPLVIEKCADPRFRDQLLDYFHRAEAAAVGQHTPHLLGEALARC